MPSLRELLLGNLMESMQSGAKNSADASQRQALLDKQISEAERMRKDYPEQNVNVEGVSIGARDPLTSLLRKQALEQASAERQEKALTSFGQRLEKSENPNMIATLAGIEGATRSGGKGGILTDPSYKVKSGPGTNLVRSIPLVGPMLTAGMEKIGINEPGTEQEAQALQRLRNIETKKFSGTAVSRAEEGRQNIEKGVSSGDPEAVKRGIAMMKQAAEMEAQNIKASTRPEVVSQYKQRGGQFELSDVLGNAPQPSESAPMSAEQRKARIAELRKKLGK